MTEQTWLEPDQLIFSSLPNVLRTSPALVRELNFLEGVALKQNKKLAWHDNCIILSYYLFTTNKQSGQGFDTKHLSCHCDVTAP